MKNLTACSVAPVSIDSLAEMLVHLLTPIAENECFPEDGFFIFEDEDENPLEDVFDVNGSANYPRILFCDSHEFDLDDFAF